jgi:hypothetical protein
MADTNAPLTVDVFESHLGTVFTALDRDQEGGYPLELVAATRVEPQPAAPRQDPFELAFESDGEPYLGQGTYEFRHDALGTLTMFVVPMGPDPTSGRMRYQAVFN